MSARAWRWTSGCAHYDEVIRDLELHLVRRAKEHDPQTFHRLRSVPGIGKILALTILYEIHDIGRFPRVQAFLSCARLVKCDRSSGGKKHGKGKALSILAHRIGRAAYFMLKRKRAFDLDRFLRM